jgi:hypothetical protein
MNILLIASTILAFAIGIVFQWLVRIGLEFRNRPELSKRQALTTESPQAHATIITVITISVALAIASWFFEYYTTQNKLSPILHELAVSVFGLSIAGLAGQIIFEFILRKELLNQTSRVLAEIIFMRRDTLQAVFSPQKINQIIEICLQIRTKNDAFGTALHRFLQPYLDNQNPRPLRTDFEDDISLTPFIKPSGRDESSLLDDYYKVEEVLYFRARPPTSNFRTGCALSQAGLYQLFNDPTCVYRWAAFCDKSVFEELMLKHGVFDAEVYLNEMPCKVIEREITKRGYEITYENPLLASKVLPEEVTYRIQVSTLHPRAEQFLSVHLAYPINQARIQFTFSEVGIHKVNAIHFFTGKEPRIDYARRADGQLGKIAVTIKDSRWILPDEGVVFVWETEVNPGIKVTQPKSE